MDGSKIHAVSYQRLFALEVQLRREVEELFLLAEQVEQADRDLLAEGLNPADEVAIRQQRLARLAAAKAISDIRAAERNRRNKPSSRPNSASGTPERSATNASHAGDHRNRPRLDRVMASSTISLIRSRAS